MGGWLRRWLWACVVLAVAGWGLVACAPPPVDPLELDARVTVVAGSAADVEVPVPGVAAVLAARVTEAAGLSVEAFPATSATSGEPVVGVVVAAAADAPLGSVVVAVEADGCAVAAPGGVCEAGSQRPVRVRVEVSVTDSAPVSPDGVLDQVVDPSAERLAAAVPVDPQFPEWKQLSDELLVLVGPPDSPGTAAAARDLASSVGASLVGGVSGLGFYQFRFPPGSDLDAAAAALAATAGVRALPSTVGGLDVDVVPSDLAGQPLADTWQWDLIDAYEAWDATTGSNVKVGVVDNGVLATHPDLRVTYNDSDPIRAGDGVGHGTHVAGLACARQNGTGVVGASWGCPVVAAQAQGPTRVQSAANLIAAMWRVVAQGSRVVNVSIGRNLYGPDPAQPGMIRCPDQTTANAAALAYRLANGPLLEQVFGSPAGRKALWTLAAGNNCVAGNQGPAQLATQYPHVLSVAAVNSDRRLATFSNSTAEIAAPGGVGVGAAGPGTIGVRSTTVRCSQTTCSSDYESLMGTSQAAPIVAGVAALLIERNPTLTADQVAACLTSTGTAVAGFGTEPAGLTNLPSKAGQTPSMPLVNADAAVDCATPPYTVSGTVQASVRLDYAPTNPTYLGHDYQSIDIEFTNTPINKFGTLWRAVGIDGTTAVVRSISWDAEITTRDTGCSIFGEGSAGPTRDGLYVRLDLVSGTQTSVGISGGASGQGSRGEGCPGIEPFEYPLDLVEFQGASLPLTQLNRPADGFVFDGSGQTTEQVTELSGDTYTLHVTVVSNLVVTPAAAN